MGVDGACWKSMWCLGKVFSRSFGARIVDDMQRWREPGTSHMRTFLAICCRFWSGQDGVDVLVIEEKESSQFSKCEEGLGEYVASLGVIEFLLGRGVGLFRLSAVNILLCSWHGTLVDFW